MKNALASFVLLAAGMAMANNGVYTMKNVQTSTRDVTTMTNTVNAWKYMGGTCKLGTLVGALGSQWCLGSDNSVYKFDMNKRQWVQQPQFGTSLIAIAAAGPSNVYSLQPVGHCGVYGGQQYYGVFRWIGSWSEDANLPCLIHLSAAADASMLAGIGFDTSTNQPALFYSSSNPGGTWPNVSWTLQKDGLISVEMGNGSVGCSVDANGGMWMVYSNAPPAALPALPSGANRAVGCLYAQSPVIAVAWTTTTGSVYAMPLENWGTWQHVTGISAVGVTGLSRYYLFGQDLSGKPYHWNVNAPGITGTYGGQWSVSQGCPQPVFPCKSTTPVAQHKITSHISFTSGHGIDGQVRTLTGAYNANLVVFPGDFNPFCDPIFGPRNDGECQMTAEGDAECLQSGTSVDNSQTNYEIDDTIDVLGFAYNETSDGPVRHQTVMYQGYYDGHVYNKVYDDCAVGDPLPACPVDTNVPLQIYNKVEWVGKLDDEARAYSTWHALQTDHVLGISAPYVSHGWYLAQRLPGGSLVLVQCYGGWLGNDDFLWGDIYAAPACK